MAEPKLNARLGLDKKEFDKGLKDAEKGVTSFGSKLKSFAAAAGLAVAAQQLIKYGAEAVKLAAKTEGIKNAFDKLNSPNLLNNLQKATRNTVADVDLMSAAVRANNFHISLEALPKYFQFAQQRARATGESVDHLVESIVMGIGRKSPMILDNLGISLAEINEELKKTPDFAVAVGNIIEKNLGDAGDAAVTAADQIAQLQAAWKNLAVEIGKGLNEGLGISTLFEDIAENMRIRADKSLNKAQRYDFLRDYADYNSYLSLREKGAGGFNFRNMAYGNLPIQGNTGGWSMMSTLKPSSGGSGTSTGDGALLEDTILGEGYWQRAVQAAVEYNNYIEANGLKISTSAGAAALPSLSQVDSTSLVSQADAIKETTFGLQEQLNIASSLQSTFADLFSAGIQGWDEFGKAAVNAIVNMLVQLAALGATYALLSMIPGFAGFMEFVGGISGGVKKGMGWASGGVNASAAAAVGSSIGGDLELRTYIRGSDLAVVVGRGGNSRYNNT